jgi:tetratricopeptide (TPR) repeat protein
VVVEKVPFIMLSAVSAVLTVMAQSAGGAIRSTELHPFGERLLVGLRSMIFYLYKMLWPVQLAPLYPYPEQVSIGEFQYIGACILVVGITIFCVWMWRQSRVWLVAWMYYVITLLPVVGIIQVGGQAAADRYTYMPSLGIFVLLGYGITLPYTRKRTARIPASLCIVLLICLLSIRTVQQERIWKDSVTLWTDEIKKFPDYYVGYRGLGGAYMKIGEEERALKNLDKAIKIDPGDSLSYMKRGDIFTMMESFHKAEADYTKALALRPDITSAYYNRGLTRRNLGDYQGAVEDFTRAVESDRNHYKAYYNLALTYDLQFGKYKEAIQHYSSAIKINPSYAKAYNNRGVVYATIGEFPEAMKDFNTAIGLDNKYSSYFYNRGVLFRMLGKEHQARRDFQEAERLGDIRSRKMLKSP